MHIDELQNDPICQLILAERQAQIEKWGKQHLSPTDWLLILNEEMGELAQALWEKTSQAEQIKEAVQVAAMAVQIAEWCSEMVGWGNTSEEALMKSLNYKPRFSTWTIGRVYLKMMNEVGSLAFAAEAYSDQSQALLGQWSNAIRNLTSYSYMLIDKLHEPIFQADFNVNSTITVNQKDE